MVKVGQVMQTISVNYSEQLPDSICTCDVNRGYFMLLLFLFVLFFVLFVCVCVFVPFFVIITIIFPGIGT